jgi:hypothetical protein
MTPAMSVPAVTPVPVSGCPGMIEPVTDEAVSVVPAITPVNEAKTQFVGVIFTADPSDEIEQNPSAAARTVWAWAGENSSEAATRIAAAMVERFLILIG